MASARVCARRGVGETAFCDLPVRGYLDVVAAIRGGTDMSIGSDCVDTVDRRLNELGVLSRAVSDVLLAVEATFPKARLRQQFKRLWPRRLGAPSEDDSYYLTGLIVELLGFARDPQGRSAFDRLARRGVFMDGSDEAAALELVRNARFRVLEVIAAGTAGSIFVRDLVSGARVPLEPCVVTLGERLAGYFVVLADGTLAVTGNLVRIDPSAWPTAAAQIDQARDGALRNPQRAAEAIYASVVAAAVEEDAPLLDSFVDTFRYDDQAAPPVSFADGRWYLAEDAPQFLHDVTQLAQTWARLDSPDPERADSEGALWLRREIQPDDPYTLTALADHVPDDGAHARALEAILRIALDTLEHRAALGIGDGLADFEADLDAPGEGLTARAWERLQRLRARIDVGARTHDPALARVIQRIRALQAKTQDAGCTEAEALAAAEKAEELLRRYDVQLTPEDIAETTCVTARVRTPRKRREALDQCARTVALVCECRHWVEFDEQERLVHIFLGLPADVAAAETLYDLIARTFETETARFKAGDSYAATPSEKKARATKSFRFGLTSGITDKLDQLAEQRARRTEATTGRDLVPVKQQAIQAALDRLGLQLKTNTHRRVIDQDAFYQGVASGLTFEPESGVADGTRQP
jgi:hypothetical protein